MQNKRREQKRKSEQPASGVSSVALEALSDFEAETQDKRKEKMMAPSKVLTALLSKTSQTKVRFLVTQIFRPPPTPWRSPLVLPDTT
jgi:hypothetical protein